MPLALASLLLSGAVLPSGCKNGNQMSQKDAQDYTAGRKPMPPQAREVLERAGRGQSPPPAQRPPK